MFNAPLTLLLLLLFAMQNKERLSVHSAVTFPMSKTKHDQTSPTSRMDFCEETNKLLEAFALEEEELSVCPSCNREESTGRVRSYKIV